MSVLTEAYTLRNGTQIPQVGFGTWLLEEGDECYDAVADALRLGYRHIDTAQAYGNEESVGEALRDSGVPREDVFITTKFHPGRTDPERGPSPAATALRLGRPWGGQCR